jgi:hypothetical protein
MFLVDYPSPNHHKPNHHTRCLHPIGSSVPVHHPFVPRLPVRPAVPYVRTIYNMSHKMNRCTSGLRFLQSCAYSSQEPKCHLGLCFVTSAAPIYTCIITREGNPISSTLAFLPFHFPTTQHHGACKEDGSRRHLGPSSRGGHLPHHRQGGRDFGGSA